MVAFNIFWLRQTKEIFTKLFSNYLAHLQIMLW